MAAAAVLSGTAQAQSTNTTTTATPEQPVIDRPTSGQPHRGKVFALITPHLDDGPIFAGGLIARLLAEGYTGYFIRTSNDEKDSFDLTLGETVLANERDTANFVKTAGLKKSYDLSYRNHRMDDVCRTELRGRLIFLFRLLKVDTILSYDPWGHYEENPDHYVTAQAVEAACREAGIELRVIIEMVFYHPVALTRTQLKFIVIQDVDHPAPIVNQPFFLQHSCGNRYSGTRTPQHIRDKLLRHGKCLAMGAVGA